MKKQSTSGSRVAKKRRANRSRSAAREPSAARIESDALAENRRLGIRDNWYENAYLVTPPSKERISIRLDDDVLEFFRSQGRGYQSRINAVLRAFMEAQKR
jgi:uncharacterized protein (DUF4415 family)